MGAPPLTGRRLALALLLGGLLGLAVGLVGVLTHAPSALVFFGASAVGGFPALIIRRRAAR